MKAEGAREVIAYITHPVLSGNAIENLNKSAIDRLVVSNSIDIGDKSKKCPKIDVFDISPIIAESIKRITTGDSISELLDNETLKLKAEIREKTGGLSSKKAIYENKLVPGVVYGGKDAPVAIQVKNNELLKIINNESVFNSLVELELADKKHNVVFKDVQKHPSKNIFIHFDLQKVSKVQKLMLLFRLF